MCAASDVGRAMLQFGAGYPLGEKGLEWLKIHLVNLHGHKKKCVKCAFKDGSSTLFYTAIVLVLFGPMYPLSLSLLRIFLTL